MEKCSAGARGLICTQCSTFSCWLPPSVLCKVQDHRKGDWWVSLWLQILSLTLSPLLPSFTFLPTKTPNPCSILPSLVTLFSHFLFATNVSAPFSPATTPTSSGEPLQSRLLHPYSVPLRYNMPRNVPTSLTGLGHWDNYILINPGPTDGKPPRVFDLVWKILGCSWLTRVQSQLCVRLPGISPHLP